MAEKEKCFCHLNGFKVKDADAHRRIDEYKILVQNYQTRIEGVETQVNTFDERMQACEYTVNDAVDTIGNIQNDFETQLQGVNDNLESMDAVHLELGARITALEENGGKDTSAHDRIDSLSNFTNTLNNSINGIHEQLSDYNSQFTLLEGANESLREDFGTLQDEVDTQIANIEERMETLEQIDAGNINILKGTSLYKHKLVFDDLYETVVYLITTDNAPYNGASITAVQKRAIRMFDGQGRTILYFNCKLSGNLMDNFVKMVVINEEGVIDVINLEGADASLLETPICEQI